jgi:hypothetical protein
MQIEKTNIFLRPCKAHQKRKKQQQKVRRNAKKLLLLAKLDVNGTPNKPTLALFQIIFLLICSFKQHSLISLSLSLSLVFSECLRYIPVVAA